MTWRKWWIEPLQQTTQEVEEEPEADAGRQTDPRSLAPDPARLLNRTTSPGMRTRALRWLGRAHGNRHVQRLLAKVRGTGRPLDAETRRNMESAFGEDFGEVRVHTDPEAEAAALEVGAQAITQGQDIYFGPDRYDPGSSEGRRLLAHELAHVVQQTGEPAPAGERRPASDPERAAEQAAATVASGGSLDFTPAPAEAAPAMSPGPWRDDVRAAQRITDVTRRRNAMVALVRRALSGTGIRVHVAGNSSPTQVHPDDYRPAPILNFDVNLNSKRSWPSRPGARTRSLSPNYGYFFTRGSTKYAIIGPRALNPDSPVFTRMHAEHELYHATQPAPRRGTAIATDADAELDAWTRDFRNYFHQLYRYRPQWAPLIGYYQRATPAARRRALGRLVAYYNNPPSPPIPAADVSRVQAAFARWLRRRLRSSTHGSMQLIQDLNSRLHLGGARPAAGSP